MNTNVLLPSRHEPATPRSGGSPSISVVIPIHNEQQNIGPLLDEVVTALGGKVNFEILCVDDASSDGSLEVLQARARHEPRLRVLAHLTQAGQSAAILTGVNAAHGPWIATLDGDGQNDPADIPRLLAALESADTKVRLVGGWRQQRRDSLSKRWASKAANAIRGRLLRDGTPDTGCGIKLFERQAFLTLPYFDHMHRYLPALMQRAGWLTLSVPVSHRERCSGRSNYSNLSRLGVGLFDLCGVAWLIRRSHIVTSTEYTAEVAATPLTDVEQIHG